MADSDRIQQTIKDTEYAATSSSGDAIITITNYYYREESKLTNTELQEIENDSLTCPYRGLFHFGPNDSEFFFGRDVFIKELYKAKTRINISKLWT